MELSRRFKDRPKTPQEEIVYWTEYVIKHKGAHHLKSTGLQLFWYQYILIDVLIVVLSMVLVALGVIVLIAKTIKKKLCGKSKQDWVNILWLVFIHFYKLRFCLCMIIVLINVFDVFMWLIVHLVKEKYKKLHC